MHWNTQQTKNVIYLQILPQLNETLQKVLQDFDKFTQTDCKTNIERLQARTDKNHFEKEEEEL